MRTKIQAFALLLSATFLLSFAPKEEHKILKIGKKAPLADQKMKNIDGSEHSLASLNQENGLLVVFSCNTCPFVVGGNDFPGWEKEYNSIYEKCQKNKIGMVLINSNEAKRAGDDSPEKMKEHAKKQSYKMPYLIDKNHALADAFGAKTTPHIFLFDKDLKLIYTGSIDNSWDAKRAQNEHYLLDAFQNISKGEKIKVATSAPRGCSIKRVK